MQRVLVFLIMVCIGLGGVVPARAEGAAGAQGGRLVLEGARAVGARLTASFDLGDYSVPVGQSVAINVDVLEGPEGPRPGIVPGYPKTTLVFQTPGRYVLTFRLSQIGKSSCGGVTAQPLLESTETIVILP